MSDIYDDDGEIIKSKHKEAHSFVSELQEKAKKAKEIKDKVTASLITAFLWSIISGIGAIIWYAFNERIDK